LLKPYGISLRVGKTKARACFGETQLTDELSEKSAKAGSQQGCGEKFAFVLIFFAYLA
jgi:hypothetical protein